MSWDLFVQDFPISASAIGEIPDDFAPRPLGDRDSLIGKIEAIVPDADFSDAGWGVIEGPDFSVEVNIGSGESVHGFALHIRGGDAAAGLVCDLLTGLGLRAIDSATGEFFDPASAQESLRKWRAYRDRVIGPPGRTGGG